MKRAIYLYRIGGNINDYTISGFVNFKFSRDLKT